MFYPYGNMDARIETTVFPVVPKLTFFIRVNGPLVFLKLRNCICSLYSGLIGSIGMYMYQCSIPLAKDI